MTYTPAVVVVGRVENDAPPAAGGTREGYERAEREDPPNTPTNRPEVCQCDSQVACAAAGLSLTFIISSRHSRTSACDFRSQLAGPE